MMTMMTGEKDKASRQRGYDYSLRVEGAEVHVPVSPFSFSSRNDAIEAAVKQLSREDLSGQEIVVVSTYESDDTGAVADALSEVEHYRGRADHAGTHLQTTSSGEAG